MKVPVYNAEEKQESEIEVPRGIFDAPWKPVLVHRVQVLEEANRRVRLAHPKSRGDVRGGGRKPWRQKGTGRARHGSIRSPIWRGGGVTFGSAPRVYERKLNRKERQSALKSLLSKKYADGNLRVIVPPLLERASSKAFAGRMQTLLKGNTLLITAGESRTLYLSARNLPRVAVIRADSVQVSDLLKHRHVVLEEKALKEMPV